jgi:very-short-patch-repair endonuclease
MKLFDIITEKTEARTKENFLLIMKQLFPYRNGCLYDFGNQENFTKNSTVNVHCKKHNVDFPALVEYLLKGRIGPNGCSECKKDDSQNNTKSTKNDFYSKVKEIWKDENGNPLYIYDRPGLRRYTGINNEFDFYCPKIGSDGKPHGKQSIKNAQLHIYQNVGCRKCKDEQGIVKQPINLSRVEFIRKVKERMKLYHIPISWYEWSGVEYKSPYQNGKIKCKKHNKEVTKVKAKYFYDGIPLCSECERIAVDEKKFMDKLREYSGNRFVLLSDYINRETPITLGCTLHGKTPYPIERNYPSSITNAIKRNGDIECKECNRVNSLNNYKRNFEDVQSNRSIKYTYPNIDKEFVNGNTKIPIECHVKGPNDEEHGMFWQTPANHSTGQGCPKCQESRNERHIGELLRKNKIEFEKEKNYPELGNQKFDFYLPEYNVLIEYDGKQHFEPTFGKSEYTRQLNYNILYESDNIKDEFVKTNNYGLGMIRIPHTLKEGQYDKLLENKLKVIEKNKIEYIGDYPEREIPKEPVHKDKVDLSQPIRKKIRTNESKLSLIDIVKGIYI